MCSRWYLLPFWREARLGLTAVAQEAAWRGHSRAEVRGGGWPPRPHLHTSQFPGSLTCSWCGDSNLSSFGKALQMWRVFFFFFPIALKGGSEEAGPQRERFQQAASWETVIHTGCKVTHGQDAAPSLPNALPPSRYCQRRLGQACQSPSPRQTPEETLGPLQSEGTRSWGLLSLPYTELETGRL